MSVGSAVVVAVALADQSDHPTVFILAACTWYEVLAARPVMTAESEEPMAVVVHAVAVVSL